MPAAFRSELLALARKYGALAEIRRAAAAADSAVLRALAREFPGALRELECLPLDAIDQRLDAVSFASDGAEPQLWIPWMVAYHARMRLALAVKHRLGVDQNLDDARAARVALAVAAELGCDCGEDFVERVAQPPGGRLNALVFELLEVEFGRPAAEIESALFPELTAVPIAQRAARR